MQGRRVGTALRKQCGIGAYADKAEVGMGPGCAKTGRCCGSLAESTGEVMQGFVLGADRQQPTLLPECLEDRVDESNSIRAVDVFAEALETPRPRVRWRPVGQRTILPNYGDSAGLHPLGETR